MIDIVRASERYHLEEDWLSTYHHFSFDTYYDPSNMEWGALRVFNDDFIAPGGKFGMHPHANFEIITVVLEGQISHQDTSGGKGITGANQVQAMTAGTGVFHSEENSGKTKLHLLQIWLAPRKRGLTPTYAQATFSPKDFGGKLCPLVSGTIKAPLHINQDATIYRCVLGKNGKTSHAPDGKYAYAYVISGELELNGKKLGIADSAKIKDEKELSFSSQKGADFVLLCLP